MSFKNNGERVEVKELEALVLEKLSLSEFYAVGVASEKMKAGLGTLTIKEADSEKVKIAWGTITVLRPWLWNVRYNSLNIILY